MKKILSITLFLLSTDLLAQQVQVQDPAAIGKIKYFLPKNQLVHYYIGKNYIYFDSLTNRFAKKDSMLTLYNDNGRAIILSKKSIIQDFVFQDSIYFSGSAIVGKEFKVITTTEDIGKDATITVEPFTVRKRNLIKLKLRSIEYDADKKIYNIKLEGPIIDREYSPKKVNIVDNFKRNIDILNSSDGTDGFFFKEKRGEDFKFRFNSWVFGGVNLPFKMRPSVDTISTVLETGLTNIGTFIGRRFETMKYSNGIKRSHNFTLSPIFIGISKITLNKTNTKNKIDKDSDRLAISIGHLVSYARGDLSLGFSLGYDWGIGKNSGDWIYQGKPWVGLALGYKISLL